MTDKEKLDKIKAYIEQNYRPEHGAVTSLRSHGNSDDVFEDGADWATCHVLVDIADIIGLALEEPHKQNIDNW